MAGSLGGGAVAASAGIGDECSGFSGFDGFSPSNPFNIADHFLLLWWI
jgi:hypothetical protein